MVAANRSRTCQVLTDQGFGVYRLYYIRTLDKREIDFVVTLDRKPVLCLEVKSGQTSLSRTLRKLFRQENRPTVEPELREEFGG
jgi:hypothetical protein